MDTYCFVIPVYRHGAALQGVLEQIDVYGIPAIVVDDGNDGENRRLIETAVEKSKNAVLVTRGKNGGKGAAIVSGIRKAAVLGATHVFQLDADGQHDTTRIPRFLELSRRHPDAVICGCPEYDASAPRNRVKGRAFANMWLHIVTLSGTVKDAMVGFRIYPVKPVGEILGSTRFIDPGMGFDIEILVRLSWKNVPIVSEPVKISYPEDGISNFRMIRDNARISCTYARLFLGMIPRIPFLAIGALEKNGSADTPGRQPDTRPRKKPRKKPGPGGGGSCPSIQRGSRNT